MGGWVGVDSTSTNLCKEHRSKKLFYGDQHGVQNLSLLSLNLLGTFFNFVGVKF